MKEQNPPRISLGCQILLVSLALICGACIKLWYPDNPVTNSPFFKHIFSFGSDIASRDVSELFRATYPELRQISSELKLIFEELGFVAGKADEEPGKIYFRHESYGGLYCGRFTRVDLEFSADDLEKVTLSVFYTCL